MDWLNTIFNEFAYPEKAREDLTCCYKKLQGSSEFELFNDCLDNYAKDYEYNFENVLKASEQISAKTGIHKYQIDMLFLIFLLKPLKEHFKNSKYSLDFWKEVSLDIKYKLLECYDVYKIYGTFVTPWFDRWFNLTRFGFGRLQFETEKLELDCVVDGVSLKKGQTVINVHIPRTGTKLDKLETENCYNKAVEFYKEHFNNSYTIFVCESYLFHFSSLSLYKKDSNLYNFTKDYTVVHTVKYENYSDLWRLFDCVIDESNLDSLPKDSSFRRAFIDYVKQGKEFGYGYGVYIRKN